MMSKGRMGTIGSLVSALGLLAALAGSAHAFTQRGVGVVTALRGGAAVSHVPEVAAREGRPAQEALKFRDDVFFRDTIDTERDSTAKLLLRGRATFTIRELSQVELREGVVPADPTRTRSIVSLLTGAFRALVQRDLRPQDELEVQTPNAVAAVRGTDVVVEVYRDVPPPLPPSASLEPAVVPASFQLAQAPPGVVSRWFVREGEIEVEGLRAQANEGIEKVGALPPRLFRFLPDFINNLVARFAIAVVQGPLGAHQDRVVAANQGRAAGEAAAPAAPFTLGAASPLVERAVNSTTGALSRDIDVQGTFTGTGTGLGGGVAQSVLSTMLRNGTTLTSSVDSAASPSPGLGGGPGTLSGTFSGTARLLSGVPGSVHILGTVVQGLGTINIDVEGPLFILGNRFGGSAAGTYKCFGSCGSPSGSLNLTFK